MKKFNVGAKISAKLSRERAIERYYSNPNYCKNCGKLIEINEGQKVQEVKVKKFCNKSCSASCNNTTNKRKKPIVPCRICGDMIRRRSKSTKFHICDECKSNVIEGKEKTHRLNSIGSIIKSQHETRTKGQIYEKYKNYTSGRNHIRDNARVTYILSGRPMCCKLCGYDSHVEICHIKAVKDFDMDVRVCDINDLDNLVALCRNHHWELDNGIINLNN